MAGVELYAALYLHQDIPGLKSFISCKILKEGCPSMLMKF